jgi:hypothetical protein
MEGTSLPHSNTLSEDLRQFQGDLRQLQGCDSLVPHHDASLRINIPLIVTICKVIRLVPINNTGMRRITGPTGQAVYKIKCMYAIGYFIQIYCQITNGYYRQKSPSILYACAATTTMKPQRTRTSTSMKRSSPVVIHPVIIRITCIVW